MNIILLSSLAGALGQPIAEHLTMKLLDVSQTEPIRIAYLQYLSGTEAYIEKTRRFYQALEIPFELTLIDLDAGYHPAILGAMWSADVLHIPGGNTFELMRAVRHRSVSEPITEFSCSDRLLVGVSAGALILAPSIGTARFGDDAESHDGDDRGLGIIDFEPFPHWNDLHHYDAELTGYSRGVMHPIRMFDDTSGIAIHGENITTYGKELVMHRGSHLILDDGGDDDTGSCVE
jgi:dipeptidase E